MDFTSHDFLDCKTSSNFFRAFAIQLCSVMQAEKQWVWVGLEKAAPKFQIPPNAPQNVLTRVGQLSANATDSPQVFSSTLRALMCVTPGPPFQDSCSVGWTEDMHSLRETSLRRATDSFAVHVEKVLLFPPWEAMPEVLKVARIEHRSNLQRPKGFPVRAKFLEGLVQIQSWKLDLETDEDTVSSLLPGLSMQNVDATTSDGYVPLGDCLPQDVLTDLKSLPCIFLPSVVGQLLLKNAWRDLVFLARWSYSKFSSGFTNHLPEAWLADHVRTGASSCIEPACLSTEAAETCVATLRSAYAQLPSVASDTDFPEDERIEGLRLDFLRCVQDLTAHRDSMWPAPQAAKNFQSIALHESFLRQILAALDLRNRGKLKAHARKFLKCLPAGMQVSAQAWVEEAFASPSKLKRGQVSLDMAMLLFQRFRVASMGPVCRFVWGDATAKGPKEIYNIRYRFFAQSETVDLARHWKWLCRNPIPQEAGDDMETEALLDQRALYSQKLFDAIELHSQIPQLLGHGRTSLVDKVGAHVMAALLEAGDLPGLESYLDSCVGWCSDMGVESGLPECNVQCAESVLPSFIRPVKLQEAPCDDSGFVDEAPVQAHEEAVHESRNLMPNALHVPGACHAIHNASLNLDGALSDFQWFVERLKTLDALISHQGRRQRFVEVALKGTPHYDEGKAVLHAFSSTLRRERWGELGDYLRKGWPIFVFLRQRWDAVAYMRGWREEGSSDQFSPAAITAIIQDDYFFTYWDLQLKLRDAIQGLLRCLIDHSRVILHAQSFYTRNAV